MYQEISLPLFMDDHLYKGPIFTGPFKMFPLETSTWKPPLFRPLEVGATGGLSGSTANALRGD